MVNFAQKLHENQEEDWTEHYLDYDALKKKLKRLKLTYQAARGGHGGKAEDEEEEVGGGQRQRTRTETSTGAHSQSSAGLSRASSTMLLSLLMPRGGETDMEEDLMAKVDELEEDFGRTLDEEVEKVVLYFLEKQGETAQKLRELREHMNQLVPPSSGGGAASPSAMTLPPSFGAAQVGAQTEAPAALMPDGRDPSPILDAINGIGVEVIRLIRFLQLNVTGLRKILKKHDKQIRDRLLATHYLSSRARVKYSSLQQLYHNEGLMAIIGCLRTCYDSLQLPVSPRRQYALRMSRRTFSGGRSPSKMERLERGDSMTSRSDVFQEIHLAQLELSVAQERTVQDYLTLSSDLLLEGGMGDEREEDASKRELDKFTAMLNLAITGFYMSNYYCVAPTSAKYAAALGGSPAMSGLIIGMTPVAACVSCVLYSWWSNMVFKAPLLLCAALLITGNFLYALALSYEALWMVLLGRLFIGLGGARGVNRRFIADTIPLEDRTFYSASFVAIGALGMAFGPAVAALLNKMDFTCGIFIFNGLTGPGWFMFAAWLVLAGLIIWGWKEPDYRYNSTKSPPQPPSDWSAPNSPRDSNGMAAAAAAADGDTAADMLSTETTALLSGGGGSNGSTSYVNTSPAAGAGAAAGGGGNEGSGDGASDHRGNSLRKKLVLKTQQSMESELGDDPQQPRGGKGGKGKWVLVPLPVTFCLFGYFVNKLVTEALVSSAPVLTEYLFEWSVARVGTLMAAMGLMTLPVNVIVGHLSQRFEDRWLLQALTVASVLGCVVILDLSSFFTYTEGQYVVGTAFCFVALQAHEGVIMSVLSKIIPPELASGTFNSGFLATEAGTFARFAGDFGITVLGVMSLDTLCNELFVSCLVTLLLLVFFTWQMYPLLQT